MSLDQEFRTTLAQSPVIAILRPLDPQRAIEVGTALIEAGILLIEVPLNSPHALEGIQILAKNFKSQALIGVGTALTAGDVKVAYDHGAQFVLSPNMEHEVITETRRLGLASIPGVATPTEAFAALKHGATALKIFPGVMFSPEAIKALRAVLSRDVLLVVSGGVSAANARSYLAAGANGFGVASAVYAPELKLQEIRQRAQQFVCSLG